MSHTTDINDILMRVDAWPVEERVALAHQILRDMRIQALAAPPRRTLIDAVGLLRGSNPPPSDADVKQWLDEHRTSKYR